jgi:hypothetical protein
MEEEALARKTIDNRDAAKVAVFGRRRGHVVVDVNADEVADLAAKGTKQRRGRRPKSAVGSHAVVRDTGDNRKDPRWVGCKRLRTKPVLVTHCPIAHKSHPGGRRFESA